jgi:hypothetical protein
MLLTFHNNKTGNTDENFYYGKLEKLLTYPQLCKLNFMTLSHIWQLTRSLYIPKKLACLRIVMEKQKCSTPDMTATHATVKQLTRKVKGNDCKLSVYNLFSSPQKLNHCGSRPNHMEMPENFKIKTRK